MTEALEKWQGRILGVQFPVGPNYSCGTAVVFEEAPGVPGTRPIFADRGSHCCLEITGRCLCRRRTLPTVWSDTWWTQVGQRTRVSIVSPCGILPSHFDDQRLKYGCDSGPTWVASMFRTVEFAGHQPAVPRQDGGWLGHTGDLCQRLESESLADLGERGPLRIR